MEGGLGLEQEPCEGLEVGQAFQHQNQKLESGLLSKTDRSRNRNQVRMWAFKSTVALQCVPGHFHSTCRIYVS